MYNLDQIRARCAWDMVAAVKALNGDQQKQFGGHAKKLPTQILTCGLGQALAFLKAKMGDRPGPQRLYTGVSAHLAERIPPRNHESRDALERLIKGDAVLLRRATGEVLALMQWVARFAEAEGMVGED